MACPTVQICVLMAFSELPRKLLIRRCCLIHSQAPKIKRDSLGLSYRFAGYDVLRYS
jgi:hypothetical protein